MLSFLSIHNYVLIRSLEIELREGLLVITGETGAGKSILLGAVNLILGKRADAKVLLDKSKKCIVEGTFSIKDYNLQPFFTDNDLDYEDYTILRREVNKNGKSRAFINDSPVNLNVLKELGEKLINVHSQDETRTLTESNFQLALIDSYAGIGDLIRKYNQRFDQFRLLQKELDELMEAENKNRSEQDYYRFLFDELEAANLQNAEQEKLEDELELLKHAEEIKSKLYAASRALDDEKGLLSILNGIRIDLNQISKYGSQFQELNARLESSFIELSDIRDELEKAEEEIGYHPGRMEEIGDRLDLLYHLESKHHVKSVEELIEVRENISEKLGFISSLESKIGELKKDISKAESEIKEKSQEISKNRKSVLSKIENKVTEILEAVGMPHARFEIEITEAKEPGREGIDIVKYKFNANKGGELHDLSAVASGGEKSRLMLALKSMISQKNLLPTVVFDEIDMGVSGAVADQVGSILLQLANSMQVIAITHLPQIAGKGFQHFLVFKETEGEGTVTRIRKLKQEERIVEIAKMLSGQDVTTASYETAKHLLKN
ncbi:MAG: DNA repair protein RecN [Bacteroidales bacterium]|nr:DNA repair protein RecN [Bacteroidales bacterium]